MNWSVGGKLLPGTIDCCIASHTASKADVTHGNAGCVYRVQSFILIGT